MKRSGEDLLSPVPTPVVARRWGGSTATVNGGGFRSRRKTLGPGPGNPVPLTVAVPRFGIWMAKPCQPIADGASVRRPLAKPQADAGADSELAGRTGWRSALKAVITSWGDSREGCRKRRTRRDCGESPMSMPGPTAPAVHGDTLEARGPERRSAATSREPLVYAAAPIACGDPCASRGAVERLSALR